MRGDDLDLENDINREANSGMEVLCLGCGAPARLRDTDEWGLCATCQTRQLACEWFAKRSNLDRDAAFDAYLEAEIEREKLPEYAVNAALYNWLNAKIDSARDDVREEVQECVR